MNKKGFTMVEMLLVFSILILILLFIIPNVTGIFGNIEENKYKTFKENLFIATEAYIADSEFESLKNNCSIEIIKIEDLLKSNYLNSTLYNPKTNKKITDEKDYIISIQKDKEGILKYDYYKDAEQIQLLDCVTLKTNDDTDMSS